MKPALRRALSCCWAALAIASIASAQGAPASARGGNPSAGRALFEGKGACLSCHMVEERGRKAGPDLSWIGILRTPESLRSSLTAPSHPTKIPEDAVGDLVAYLRTLRYIWPVEPGERTRQIGTVSENISFFDRPGRDAEERSDAIVDALEIPEGSTIADIGSGTGYFTWRLAVKTGPRGKVIAVDIQEKMIELTAQTIKERNLTNVEYVLGRESDPGLVDSSIDLAFIAYAYHEFAEPEEVMERIRKALKPAGRMFILEFAKESKSAPASGPHKMSFDEIRNEIEPIGFELVRVLDFLPMQHGLVFARRP